MKEQAKQRIKELVDRFRYNLDVYKESSYNEAQVRIEFINPFFEALGWDVRNKQGFAEQYKEVIYEDVIKVGRSTRAPDYSFRIGGQRKFFVEAKKPAVNVKEDVSPAYQLRRYAWSAKLPLSVVTDFEEFSVFDCRIKPNPNDKSSVGRIAYYTFDEYLDSDKFDAIYDVFSKEAVLKGGFDRYAESTKGKKGTAEVDSEFLKEIESWRELLAKNIALRNPDVSIYELNYAVQKIIDRIIFLRICEDRGIEPYGQLQTKAESGDVYTHLLNHFKLAESKYDSGIFNFDTDRITPALKIDDRVLKTIIQSLYYPKSPYEFSVLGVEILGNVYEQFLGKVIRLTVGHQAKVETKPEVKKAGGVYYTPQYIVDYIVKNTVGKLVAGKTPEEIAEIKILDPACGSGSFLIGAYTYLLRYHLDWYTSNEPKKHKEAVFQVRENEWYLTTAEKKRILLNNIFGVDIDPQAVEVTKLSLLLKVLENESRESIDQQMKLGLEGVLPSLEGNIKCGNSLIGPDFYDSGQQERLFDEEEMRRVNVFDWDDDRKGFGGIMKRGGFDCVIGNPPYITLALGKKQKFISKEELAYFTNKFQKSSEYKGNTYTLFMDCGLHLLKNNGKLGFIIPNTLLANHYFRKIREYILDTCKITHIVNISDRVFKDAEIGGNVILILESEKNAELRDKNKIMIVKVEDAEKFSKNLCDIEIIEQELFERMPVKKFLLEKANLVLITKLEKDCVKLGDIATTYQGVITGDNKKFLSNKKETEKHRKIIRGKNIERYSINFSETYVYFDKDQLWSNTDESMFLVDEKIISRQTSDHLVAAYDNEQYFSLDSTHVIIPHEINAKYFLALFNSRLLNYYYQKIVPEVGRTFAQVKTVNLKQLPIRTIDFSNPEEAAKHDKLVSLVDNMLELQKKYHDARMDRDKELYERQIKIVDAQIDKRVYDLYGLTEEEVRVVEG
ncbi:MAG: N-6 DNA methylase [Methanophagales archaeon]|nr:N-6 DNA methylase [Methanophagales archaeon]